MMNTLIQKFKNHVIEESQKRYFVHHEWFVEFHLKVVEKISKELCDKYIDADKDMVNTLVWLHDYGKIINRDNQYKETLISGKLKLEELGFPQTFIDKALSYVEIIDQKENLDRPQTPIEVKIISSADGAAHLVGPFFSLWWLENSEKNFEDLMQDNLEKASKDWNKKIVLPEVKKAFKERYEFLIEQSGSIPDKFLD